MARTPGAWLALLVVAAVLVAPGEGRSFPPPEHPAPIEGPRDCTPVQGTFTNVFLMGPVCSAPPFESPIGLCTEGQLSGDLNGTYRFTFFTNEPVGQGGAPVVRFTGQSAVTTAEGTLVGEDFGLLRTTQFPLADFTTHLRIQSGTGIYEGATGQLTIQGEASFITGLGAGTYRGVVCVPREEEVAQR